MNISTTTKFIPKYHAFHDSPPRNTSNQVVRAGLEPVTPDFKSGPLTTATLPRFVYRL